MENIFKNGSWEIESGSNNLNLNTISNLKDDSVTLKYIKPIFFDESVRIDIKFIGSFKIMVNEHTENFSSDSIINTTVNINNFCLNCNDNKVNLSNENNLKIILNKNSKIESLTIIQDLSINGCNPNN